MDTAYARAKATKSGVCRPKPVTPLRHCRTLVKRRPRPAGALYVSGERIGFIVCDEKFLRLLLRIDQPGLADVKARRAGVQLGMLFIDEPPFLDADGTEAYADALVNMAARNPKMRILAISHDPTMKARFSQNIIVTGGEDGSSVTME